MKATLYTFLSIFIFSFNGLAQTDLDSGLIARYTFDNHIKDSSINKHHGTLVDGTFTTDRFGNPKSALYFDGNDDYARIAKFGKFIPTKDFTMTLWAKSVGNKTSNTLMLMSDNTSNRIALSLYYSHSGSGSFFWDYAGITTRIFVQSVKPSGGWEFFVVYYNSKTKKIGLYRDVNLMQELSTTSVFAQDSTKDLHIGGGADGYYNGTLDDVRFYDRILDTTDIRRLYTNNFCLTKISSHPTNQYANLETTAKFSVICPDKTANYKWQVDAGSGYSNISNSGQYSGASTNQLTIAKVKFNINNAQKYRCIVSSTACSDTSDAAALYVSCVNLFTSDPKDVIAAYGSDVQFYTTPIHFGTTLQWQKNNGTGFVNLTNSGQYFGYDADTLTIFKAKRSFNNEKYQCIASYEGCYDTTKIATLNVNCMTQLAKQPGNVSSKTDNMASFSVSSLELNSTFSWQTKIGSIFQNISNAGQFAGADNNSLVVKNLQLSNNDQQFRCVLSMDGCFDTSSIATLTVTCKRLVDTQPADVNALQGSTINFVAASKDTLASYIWQSNIGFGFQALSNAGQFKGVNNDTLIVSNLTFSNHNQNFRCVITKANCMDTTKSVVLTVKTGSVLLIEQGNNIHIYPNPAHIELKVVIPNGLNESKYKIMDMLGREILYGLLQVGENGIDISTLAIGTYTIQTGRNFEIRSVFVKY